MGPLTPVFTALAYNDLEQTAPNCSGSFSLVPTTDTKSLIVSIKVPGTMLRLHKISCIVPDEASDDQL